MGLDQLSSIYQQVLMQHYKFPKNKGEIAHPTHQMHLLNPTCGDDITIQCRVEDNVIQEIGFTGIGCAISTASASMMTQALQHRPIDEALVLVDEFNALIGGESQQHLTDEQLKDALKEAYLLKNIKNIPARYKCAILAWRALEKSMTSTDKEEVYE